MLCSQRVLWGFRNEAKLHLAEGSRGAMAGGGGVKLANVTEEVVVMYARRQHGEECR